MYQLRLTHKARQDLDKLSESSWEWIQNELNNIGVNPKPRNHIQLQGGAYRVVAGDYKILYDIDDKNEIVTILRVKYIPNSLEDRIREVNSL